MDDYHVSDQNNFDNDGEIPCFSYVEVIVKSWDPNCFFRFYWLIVDVLF